MTELPTAVLKGWSSVTESMQTAPKITQTIMDAQKVDMFIMANGKYFAEEKISFIRTKLLELDDSKWALISSLQFKSPTVALVLSIFLGGYGIDRFYIGHIGLGVGKLLTCGGIGIWAIIDWFLILGATRNENLKKLEPLLL